MNPFIFFSLATVNLVLVISDFTNAVPVSKDNFSLSLFVVQVLEKMRPLDQKLKYQIDKLVRTAVTGSLGKYLNLTLFVIDRTC